jgi:molybdate transport repressor ModE-like protein
MDLDVRRLRVLREVALRGTIAAAAESLGFTPSAISQQLSALQRETGSNLLERAGRGMRLTHEGQVLVEHTECIITALEEARAALEESRATIAGELRVAASGSVARAFVIPVIADVARLFPRLHVTLLQYEPSESIREVRLGGLDLVVAHEYEHDRNAPHRQVVRIGLFEEELYVVATSGRFRAPVSLGDLAGEIWAAEPPNTACGRALLSACRQAGFEPDVRYHSSESTAVFAAVACSGAVSLLPNLACGDTPSGVDVLPLASSPPRRMVFAAYRRGDPVRSSIRIFIDRLKAAASGPCCHFAGAARPDDGAG